MSEHLDPTNPDRTTPIPTGSAGTGSTVAAGSSRRGLPFAAVVGLLALALVLVGGIAYAITSASQGTGTSTPGAAPTAAGGSPTTKGSATAKHKRLLGRITAISGNTWTLATPKAGVVQVTIDAKTRFGTAAKPAQRTAFKVGSLVGVAGQVHGGKVTAKRVLLAPAKTAKTASPSSTATAAA